MAKAKSSGAKAANVQKGHLPLRNGRSACRKELRTEVREYAKRFSGTSVNNVSSGFNIKITSRGIKEATSGYRRPEELKAVKRLPKMLKRAIYVGNQPNKKNNPGVKQYHVFETTAQVEGKRYTFTLKIRELQDGHYFYDSYTKK